MRERYSVHCLQSGPRLGHGSRQFGGLRLQRVTSSLSPLIHSLRATRRRSNSSAAIHDSDDAKPLCIHLFLIDNQSSLKPTGINYSPFLSPKTWLHFLICSHTLHHSFAHTSIICCTYTALNYRVPLLRSGLTFLSCVPYCFFTSIYCPGVGGRTLYDPLIIHFVLHCYLIGTLVKFAVFVIHFRIYGLDRRNFAIKQLIYILLLQTPEHIHQIRIIIVARTLL